MKQASINQPQPHSGMLKRANFMIDACKPILQQERRRLLAALGHIVTTSAATAIVAGLFVYIFGDFLQVKLPNINREFAGMAWTVFLYLVILLWGVVVYRWTNEILFHPHNWFTTLHSFGVAHGQLKRFRQLFALGAALLGQIFCCFLLTQFFQGVTFYHWLFAATQALIISFAVRKPKPRVEEHHKTSQSCHDSTVSPLLSWRQTRVVTNSWPGASLRILASLPFILGSVVLAMGYPAALAQLCVLLGGIIFSWVVPMLVAEDLESTWIERQAAVGHEKWIQAWQQLFFKWSKTIFVTVFIMIFVAAVAADTSFNLHASSSWLAASELAAIGGFLAAFPIWLAPALVMQIDGQRVMTNILMITLVCIFVGTAIMAVPLLFVLVFLLHREAHRYQGGRFARGSHH